MTLRRRRSVFRARLSQNPAQRSRDCDKAIGSEDVVRRRFERYEGSCRCKPGWVTCGDLEECWFRGAGGPALHPNLDDSTSRSGIYMPVSLRCHMLSQGLSKITRTTSLLFCHRTVQSTKVLCMFLYVMVMSNVVHAIFTTSQFQNLSEEDPKAFL